MLAPSPSFSFNHQQWYKTNYQASNTSGDIYSITVSFPFREELEKKSVREQISWDLINRNVITRKSKRK